MHTSFRPTAANPGPVGDATSCGSVGGREEQMPLSFEWSYNVGHGPCRPGEQRLGRRSEPRPITGRRDRPVCDLRSPRRQSGPGGCVYREMRELTADISTRTPSRADGLSLGKRRRFPVVNEQHQLGGAPVAQRLHQRRERRRHVHWAPSASRNDRQRRRGRLVVRELLLRRSPGQPALAGVVPWFDGAAGGTFTAEHDRGRQT